MFGGEILSFVDDDVFELVIVAECASEEIGEFFGGGVFVATGFSVKLVEISKGDIGEFGGKVVFEILNEEFVETEEENVGIPGQASGAF